MKEAKTTKITVPTDLHKALTRAPEVLKLWKDITPIARRDFISWIESAKQDETRKRRIEVTLSKLKSGKRRPCCYAVVPMNLYKALGENKKAKATWSTLSPDERRDFVDWIESVKQPEKGLRIEKTIIILEKGRRKP